MCRRCTLFICSLPWLLAACAGGRSSRDDRDRIAVDRRGQVDNETPDALTGPDLARWPDGRPLADLQRLDGRSADGRPPDTRPPDKKLPPDQRPPDTGPRVLFSYDFEANNGGLVPSLDWQWGALAFKAGADCEWDAAPPSSCHSGTHCWGTVLNDCYSPKGNNADPCANKDSTDDSILLLKFQIPADYKGAKLIFWEWTDFYTPYDWSEVRVNGQVLWQTCPSTYTAPSSWKQRSLDLTFLIGKSVTVGFHFMASTVVNLSGWYLDDISLREQ